MFKKKKFGEIALRKGYISELQLQKALTIQKEILYSGDDYKKIGVILHEMGNIEDFQLELILQHQEKFFFLQWIYTAFGTFAK